MLINASTHYLKLWPAACEPTPFCVRCHGRSVHTTNARGLGQTKSRFVASCKSSQLIWTTHISRHGGRSTHFKPNWDVCPWQSRFKIRAFHHAHSGSLTDVAHQPSKLASETSSSAEARARNLQQILNLLPTGVTSERKSASPKQRREWQVPKPLSMRRQRQTPYDVSDDWQEILKLLKENTVSRRRDRPSRHVWRYTQYVFQQDHVNQTLQPPKAPSTWTKDSFTAYIHSVINFRPTRKIINNILPQGSRPNTIHGSVNRIAMIEQAFNDPDLRSVVTVEAGNTALQHFYDKSQMDQARALYRRMEQLFSELPASTHNIILRASASGKDIYNFRSLLKIFTQRGFRADEQTWVSTIILLSDTHARNEVVDAMRSRGFMNDPKVGREVANHLCRSEFLKFESQSADSRRRPFFETMKDLYGSEWLRPSAGNAIIAEVLNSKIRPRHGALARALALLPEMKQCGFAANSLTVERILQACTDVHRGDVAIEVLQIMHDHWGLVPDRQAHWRLFQYAWQHRKLNFLRVVWISACLNGFTTYRMRQRVMQSVTRKKDANAAVVKSTRFFDSLGWFLLSLHPQQSSTSLVASDNTDATNQYRLAMQSNLATVGQGSLKDGLVECLKKALSTDDFHMRMESTDNVKFQEEPVADVKVGIDRPTEPVPAIGRSATTKLVHLRRRQHQQILAMATKLRRNSNSLGSVQKIGQMPVLRQRQQKVMLQIMRARQKGVRSKVSRRRPRTPRYRAHTPLRPPQSPLQPSRRPRKTCGSYRISFRGKTSCAQIPVQ